MAAVTGFHDELWALREEAAKPRPTGLLARLRWTRARRRYREAQLTLGFWLPIDATFAGKPYFPHGVHGIYVSNRARVGSHCVIYQQVTIGSNVIVDSSGLGAPVIGDRCYIGAGAKIVGGIVLGSDVRIGANAVVSRDVPDGATVIGFNDVRPGRSPRDNRYFRKGAKGWEAIDGDRVVPATVDETARLDAAFPG